MRKKVWIEAKIQSKLHVSLAKGKSPFLRDSKIAQSYHGLTKKSIETYFFDRRKFSNRLRMLEFEQIKTKVWFNNFANITKRIALNDIFIIEEGTCHIRFDLNDPLNSKEQQCFSELHQGEIFGESICLKQQSLDYFGPIYASSEVRLIKLTRFDFERIPFYERVLIKKLAG